jgi:phage FluMu gp28-like protein
MSICLESLLSPRMSVPEIIWASLTFDQSRTAMDETRKAVGANGTMNESRMSCTLPNGGRILYRSLDHPDTLRSKTAGGVVIDEAPFTSGRAWHEVVRPTLIDTNGFVWLIGTPKGQNWYWQEWQKAASRPDWALFHAPTLGVCITEGGLVREPHPLENPYIPYAEIVDLYNTMPERAFRQEILAEFTESGGGVFRRVRECAVAQPQDKPIEGHLYVAGVDWARTNDYTVICVIDATIGALVYMDRFNQIDYRTQTSRLVAVCERFNLAAIYSEANSMGGPLTEDLQQRGLPVYRFDTTAQSKQPLIQSLELAFERDQIKILPDEILIGELQAYEQQRMASGIHYGAPEGMHDDCVMALSIAWRAAGRMGSIF